MLLNLAVCAVLLMAWRAHSGSLFIGGLYLVLTALARFGEEGWRGEPQTPGKCGLSLYQWICIPTVLVGVGTSMIASTPVPIAAGLDGNSLLTVAGLALFLALMMSCDWPRMHLPFSRLAPPR